METFFKNSSSQYDAIYLNQIACAKNECVVSKDAGTFEKIECLFWQCIAYLLSWTIFNEEKWKSAESYLLNIYEQKRNLNVDIRHDYNFYLAVQNCHKKGHLSHFSLEIPQSSFSREKEVVGNRQGFFPEVELYEIPSSQPRKRGSRKSNTGPIRPKSPEAGSSQDWSKVCHKSHSEGSIPRPKSPEME